MTKPSVGLDGVFGLCLSVRSRAVLHHTVMQVHRASMVLMLAAGALAGCSGFGKPQQAATPDPNLLPANYRTTLLAFLRQSLTNKDDFRGAMISEPAIKPVEGSAHYVVCIQFNPKSAIKTKAAIFLSGQMTQFVDAAPEQCADAAYQPFKELDAANPAAPASGHFQLLGVPQ